MNDLENGASPVKPPLVEVVFDVHWGLADTVPIPSALPAFEALHAEYQLAVGRFQQALEKRFPFYEALPVPQIPGLNIANVPQHRFRTAKDAWPGVQLGPGILSLVYSSGYNWSDFRRDCSIVIQTFIQALPQHGSALKFLQVNLRYVNAVPLDDLHSLAFLSKKMGVDIRFPNSVEQFLGVQTEQTSSISLDFAFSSKNPKGTIRLEFMQGRQNETVPVLLWKTSIFSGLADVPVIPDALEQWLDSARTVAHRCFEGLNGKSFIA